MKRPFPPRYFLGSVLLLSALIAVFAASAALRTQRELSRQLEEKGLALADALETSSRNAILGNALMERMIAERLFDNARLLDQLLLVRRPDPAWLRQLGATNGLRRVELLDREGRPWVAPPEPPRGMGHRGAMGPMGMMMMMGRSSAPPAPEDLSERHRAMMTYMWGRRWAAPPAETPEAAERGVPTTLRDRRFWEGSVFGVAMGARSFPGIIAIHADADYVLNFTREVGVQRQVEELGRQAGIASVALLDETLTVVAHSDPGQLGQREADAGLREALETRRTLARLVRAEGASSVYQVVRPLTLRGSQTGLLRIALSTASMERVWRQDRLAAVVLGLAVLGLGVLGMAAIFYTQHRHLADRRALEAEMTRRERLSTLGDLAATVAHEIRNPLNAVSMGLQRLRVEFEPPAAPESEEYRRLVELVQSEVRRLNGIVEEFLSLARPAPLKPETVLVADLVNEVVALVEGQARDAGVRIERALPPELPVIRADRDRLKQVLLNLVLNAIQAMPDGGALGLSVQAGRHTLTLTVSDSGTGIPPEGLLRAFEPYYTTKVRGLGLGLPIARQIVEAHGGTLEVESAVGRGSRFRITLPLPPGEA